MTVQAVVHGSPEQAATIRLRREVLRFPLGLDFTEAQLAEEREDTHFAILEEGEALACLVLTPHDATTLRMRQVAVRPDRQGEGLGRRLVEASEAWAREHGFDRMTLHSREAAAAFYFTLGYIAEGEPFEEIGIPHRSMSKLL